MTLIFHLNCDDLIGYPALPCHDFFHSCAATKI